MPINILIVDDSPMMRRLLTDIFAGSHDFSVIGDAPDPFVAREMIKRFNPDVITLDIEMPKMNGLDFLEKLMRLRPTPVVMVSSLTEKGSIDTLHALELGAVDYVLKPSSGAIVDFEYFATEICDKVRAAALAKPHTNRANPSLHRRTPKQPNSRLPVYSDDVIAIGASTGGTEALRNVLEVAGPDCPGILIAQHMPPVFTTSFAKRLNATCAIAVCEARDGEPILRGHAYIAPGDFHLELARKGNRYETRLSRDEPVSRHRPSVDVLFRSIAKAAKANATGVILTGMGSDGAKGLREMRLAGCKTIAQDEASCAIFGMPKAAIAAGAASAVLPLHDIGQVLFADFTCSNDRNT